MVRPVLHAVLLPTNHLSPHFLAHLFISEGSAKKRHHVRIAPEVFGETEVTFLPGAEEQSIGA
jgi:hypothetical protein